MDKEPLIKGSLGSNKTEEELIADAVWLFLMLGALSLPIFIHLIWRVCNG